MARYDYRLILPGGREKSGQVDASSRDKALASVRGGGGVVVQLVPAAPAQSASRPRRRDARSQAAVGHMLGELAVLLRAGLPIDRALTLAIQNIEPATLARRFAPVLEQVRQGKALSDAMASFPELFPPVVLALTQAGEASGTLADALARLSEMMERASELRRLAVTSSIYPLVLSAVAIGVVLMMLLFVVPQFESMMGSEADRLPAASQGVLHASQFVRTHGIMVLLAIILAGGAARMMLRRPGMAARLAALWLRLPLVGPLIQRFETARFARTLGALIEGQVPLPQAIQLAQRTIGNAHMAQAMLPAVSAVREGAGLTAPLAAAKVLPDLAMGFIRTGEESSELGLMLARLADVLDRDVKVRLERLVAIATPMVTLFLAACVTGIIASIMAAILGFNDLALAA